MKYLVYLLPLIAALSLTSCSDDNETAAPVGGPGTLSATVDGVRFTSVVANTYASTSNGFTLNGASAANSISIIVFGATSPGTYNGNEIDIYGGYTQTNVQDIQNSPRWESYDDSTATVTITKWENNLVSGTFSFKADAVAGGAAGIKTITEGTFTDVEVN